MRKLLSILASIGLVATASTSVVACSKNDTSNNPSHSYKELKSWIADSSKNSETDLVFVGGRHDSDSLSWLAARKYAVTGSVDTQDFSTFTDKSDVDKVDKQFGDFNSWANASTNASAINNIRSTVENAADAINKGPSTQQQRENYFWTGKTDGTSTYSQKIALHSILVDDLSKFFTNGVGQQFIKDFIKDEATTWNAYYHTSDNDKNKLPDPNASKDKNDKNKDNPEVDAVVTSITSTLTSAKGPYFLVFNNGHLAGITTGFKNYSDINSDLQNNTDTHKAASNDSVNDIASLFTDTSAGLASIWNNIDSWIQNNLYPHATSTASSLYDSTSSITGWGTALANINKDVTATKSDNSGSKDSGGTTKAYKLNINKYIA